jgi:chitodextrinase
LRYTKATVYAILLALIILGPMVAVRLIPSAHAATSYSLTAVPILTQEGYTVTLVLTVFGASPGTTYGFNFNVADPSGTTTSTTPPDTTPTTTEFTVLVQYPSPSFLGKNSLVGQYAASVDQTKPTGALRVASTPFYIVMTDKLQYQRTETVSIRATAYNPSDSVTVTIRTQTTSTLVYSATIVATIGGIVTTSWSIPKNATLDNYILTLSGISTLAKSPPDVQSFNVRAAAIAISALSYGSSVYQRTELMKFFFQPIYPSGQTATTGLALVTLTSPSRANITLTAVYDNITQTFVAKYRTFWNNQTGTWTASLARNGYNDGFGNFGPSTILTSSPRLQPATFAISIMSLNTFAVSQQIKFNATIPYPDGTRLTSGQVGAFLLYSGGGYNFSIPVIYDTTLGLWVGTYNPHGNEPGGLWSLTISAADSASPPNSGQATKTITLPDRPPVASFTASSVTAVTGSAISFNATASYDPDGTISTFGWNFGDGSTGSGMTVTHSYASPGTYTVRLNVTDNSGSPASYTLSVTVQAPPPSPSANASFPLFYFGILAAIIAAILTGGFFAFKRHKITHARLKIDLEAVKTEAGRIENQEFFQSVKDQLKKDKDD